MNDQSLSADLKRYALAVLKTAFASWEVGDRMGSTASLVLAIAIGVATALGIEHKELTTLQTGGWAVGAALFVLLVVVAPFRLWRTTRHELDAFQSAAKVAVVISDPVEVPFPKVDSGPAQTRTIHLEIENPCSVTIRNCSVRLASMTNIYGKETETLGQPFRLSTERPHNVLDFVYTTKFDIHPLSSERIDIASLEETDSRSNVIILYATQGKAGAGVLNSIPVKFFPHTLKIRVTADNLLMPVERTFQLYVDQQRCLRMFPHAN